MNINVNGLKALSADTLTKLNLSAVRINGCNLADLRQEKFYDFLYIELNTMFSNVQLSLEKTA